MSKNFNDDKVAYLGCDYVRLNEPEPLPIPQRSWYEDGQLVYSAPIGSDPNISEFLAANPLLTLGVYEKPLQTLSYGGILLLGGVLEIGSPSLLPPNTTLEQANEQILALVVGNWTCQLNNTFGSSSVTYTIRECGELNQI